MHKFLLTGVAGFIGFHVAQRLLARGDTVLGVDNLNDYYDVTLKEDRLSLLSDKGGFRFSRTDIRDKEEILALFEDFRPDYVIHLAAQAGVRYSLKNPDAYLESNILGFGQLLEGARKHPPQHFVFASSSSVYGANGKLPFSVSDNVDHPLSLYAATKKANELMAHSYAHLYGLPLTGLRFFTVYGPWGRPDMALFLFTRAILEGRPIDVFNHGAMRRDFTYIDDIVEGVVRVTARAPSGNPRWDAARPDPGSSRAPYRLYNIGGSNPVALMDLVAILEQELGRKADKRFLPLQDGDVPATYAEVTDLEREFGFRPRTTIEEGVKRFVAWYRAYYGGKS
jgi:UDP-glucuronate 4-epimerase